MGGDRPAFAGQFSLVCSMDTLKAAADSLSSALLPPGPFCTARSVYDISNFQQNPWLGSHPHDRTLALHRLATAPPGRALPHCSSLHCLRR